MTERLTDERRAQIEAVIARSAAYAPALRSGALDLLAEIDALNADLLARRWEDQVTKFLTIRQPWASLIAVGAKTIETRPFSTTYRGPLAIHAGKAKAVFGRMGNTLTFDDAAPKLAYATGPTGSLLLPFGAVVAVCDLVDVLPIVDSCGGMPVRHVAVSPELTVCRDWSRTVSDQLPFGDFTPGRYAWLLDHVRPVDPVPMKGAQGLRDLPDEIEAVLGGDGRKP